MSLVVLASAPAPGGGHRDRVGAGSGQALELGDARIFDVTACQAMTKLGVAPGVGVGGCGHWNRSVDAHVTSVGRRDAPAIGP